MVVLEPFDGFQSDDLKDHQQMSLLAYTGSMSRMQSRAGIKHSKRRETSKFKQGCTMTYSEETREVYMKCCICCTSVRPLVNALRKGLTSDDLEPSYHLQACDIEHDTYFIPIPLSDLGWMKFNSGPGLC